MLEFQRQQRAFSAHLRDPAAVPMPAGLEDRRVAVYRELFYNNFNTSLSGSFPVLRALYDDTRWHAMVRDFFARHRCQDPLFHQMAKAFLDYLETERGEVAGDPPFLRELAHYEWVELALSAAEDDLSPAQADPNGDLLDAPPLVSPLAWTLAYDWPVHRIAPDFQPVVAPATPTFLVVYRTRQDEVKFTEINAVTARLLALIEAHPGQPGRALIAMIEQELQARPGTLLAGGQEVLLGLRRRDVILGTRRI